MSLRWQKKQEEPVRMNVVEVTGVDICCTEILSTVTLTKLKSNAVFKTDKTTDETAIERSEKVGENGNIYRRD